jgi:2-C-methyl-D-erythritol 4-phosphate cytidylyltransferase
MGGDTKKEYLSVDSSPVLVKTLHAFFRATSYQEVVVTVPPGHEEQVRRLIDNELSQDYTSEKDKIRLIAGGETRQESVYRGLEAFSPTIEYSIIHDAARPWISVDLIRSVLRDCIANEASIPVISITDAVKQIDLDGNIEGHLARNRTMGAQTPQAFSFPAILDAHQKAASDGTFYIDDSEIFTRYVGPVHTVAGDPENIKITFPVDLRRGSREQNG